MSCAWVACAAAAGALPPVIRVPAEPTQDERSAARVLEVQLGALYGTPVTVQRGAPATNAPCILVGRRLSVESGMIAPAELDAVKFDGYVVRADGQKVAIAGYGPQGTIYAAYALLRRLGMRFYPWRDGADDGTVRVVPSQPLELATPFVEARRPFFAYRDLLQQVDRGRYGSTLREYVLGNPQEAANPELFGRDRKNYTPFTFEGTDFVDWFHTAPYLVPRDLYYRQYPEYFAMKDGQRIPPQTYVRMAVCMTHPEARRISRERAQEWMRIQKDRRLFAIAQADADLCECPACRGADPWPGICTDRMLDWVNDIAVPVRDSFPDRVILASAYLQTVKPPVRVHPAANVVVLYSPWFWNSRATAAAGFDHPMNVTAMQEFLGWTRWCPGQVGVYDYPGSEADGAAERIKFFARHGVRYIYFNGANGDRLQWLASQLTWDPFLDTTLLDEEFCRAYYGPAADEMIAWFELRREVQARFGRSSRAVFRKSQVHDAAAPARYFEGARALLSSAVGKAEKADPGQQIRILAAALDGLADDLAVRHPTLGRADLCSGAAAFEADNAAWRKLGERLVSACARQQLPRLERTYRERIARTLAELTPSLTPSPDAVAPAPGPARGDALYDRAIATAEDMKDAPVAPPSGTLAPDPGVAVLLGAEGEAGRWRVDASQPALIAPAVSCVHTTPAGDTLRGVGIDAALSQLPVVTNGHLRLHAGRVFAERIFSPAVGTAGRHFLDIHLHASTAVPVTFYMNGIHSDVFLHAGEQVVRIDLRAITSERFSVRDWRSIESLAIDLYPQDNHYPFPAVRDVRVTLFGIRAGAAGDAADLPHRGRAVWLTQFRPNLPFEPVVPADQRRLLDRQGQPEAIPDREVRRDREQFRSFTEHRARSPIYSIRTGPADRAIAEALQSHLARLFGVKLPIEPAEGLGEAGNVMRVGAAATGGEGGIDPAHLELAGPGGYVIQAWQGRIDIAGPDSAGTTAGVIRYLEEHGARRGSSSATRLADSRNGFLHELWTQESSWFGPLPEWAGQWWLEERPDAPPGAASREEVEQVQRMAVAFKDIARSGQHALPPEWQRAAARSELSRAVAARLWANPLADSVRLIREYTGQKGMR